MLALLFITLSLTITSSSTLQLPVREVLKLDDSELSVLDFIKLSYQPLLFPDALSANTVSSLTPWTFPALPSSIEAATSFCIASKGSLSHHSDVNAERDLKWSKGKVGEREGKGVIKENAQSKGKDGEGNFSGERENRYENDIKTKETHEGKPQCEGNWCIMMEKESAEIIEKTEERKKTAGMEKEEQSKATEEIDTKREIPMSLRRFGIEGPGKGWHTAFTSITKELGLAITLPGVLKDADLAFLDLTGTGLRHVRKGWNGWGPHSSNSRGSASVVCVVEGGLTVALSPLPPSLAALKCIAGQCWAILEEHQEQTAPPDLHFIMQTTILSRACLYTPPGWQWAAEALEDSTFLVFAWEDDLVIKKDVVDLLFKDEDENKNKRTQRGKEQVDATNPPTLWEALPKGALPPALLLWGDQNPLLHLMRRYLLSDRSFRRYSFLKEFQADRLLMPDLVDCSRECQKSAIAVFKLLDADADGELSPSDAILLTQDTFTSLSHQLDDLVDELNDLAREQWEEAVEGPEEQRSAFLRRAKERLSASASAAVRRWVAGDLEETEEETLKEHLPDLYEQVLAARGVTPPRGKEEL